MRVTLLLAAASAFSLGACTSTNAGGAGTAEARAAAGWPAFVSSYIEQTFRANPAFAVGQGRHEYDGHLPDWSETGLLNEAARLRTAIAAASAFDPQRLTREQRFERDYLIARARGDLF